MSDNSTDADVMRAGYAASADGISFADCPYTFDKYRRGLT